METSQIDKLVAAHYSGGNVKARILEVLGLLSSGHGTIEVDRLFPVDQLHHGGVGLTERMAQLSGVSSGMAVLDAGSGIGGSARFLVDRFGCEVEAIDLSEEFVRTAEELDQLVGLGVRIKHRVGTVVDLPYSAEAFDIVWSQNVTMNVPDKRAMFAEAFRVLRPGGMYVMSHIGEGEDAAIDYPVPWAMTAETSFTTPPAEFLKLLRDVGFQNVTDHAKSAPSAPPPATSDGQPDDSAAMGDDMPERRANSGRAVASGNLIPMLVTAMR